MLRVVARLPDGEPFGQYATSFADALTILRATMAFVGGPEKAWIERDGHRLDPEQIRRELALLNLPGLDPLPPKYVE